MSSWPVGYIVAAAIAGWVLPQYGWRVLFLIGGGALLASLFVALAVPESKQWVREKAAQGGGQVAIGEIFNDKVRRHTILGTLAAGCALTGYWGANTWLPTYLIQERGLEAGRMTEFVIAMNIGMFIGYQAFGWVADILGQRRALIICFVGAATLLPIYALVSDPSVVFWLGPILGFFFAYTGPFGAYFPTLFPTRLRALGAGFCFDAGRAIAALAPFALGSLATVVGLSWGVAVRAIPFLLAAFVVFNMPVDHDTGEQHVGVVS